MINFFEDVIRKDPAQDKRRYWFCGSSSNHTSWEKNWEIRNVVPVSYSKKSSLGVHREF